MRTMLLTAASIVLLFGAASIYGQEAPGGLSADDFITEAQGGSSEIAAPKEITVKGDVVVAATMQDAANKAEQLTAQEYQEDEAAFKLITSKKGGVGAIATGRATYATGAKNKDAIRLAMRHAYIKAFMEAKKNLTAGFNGLSSDGVTILNEALTTIVNNDETLKNKETNMTEIIAQRTEGFIRAYAVRSVKVDEKDSTVYVTIYVNGKTLGKHSRPVPAVIEADDIKTGLNQAFDEIQKGIALPAGGRAIMTDKGDVCYVGFGSALIRSDNDPEMQAELTNDARKIAIARAMDSLTGMICGDAVVWENKVVEKHAKSMKDFEDVAGNDATADMSPKGIKKFGERQKAALTQTMTSDTTQSIRRGVLPPGISPKTFRDKDNVWYYAVVVYNPVITQAASDLAGEMGSATLIQPIRNPSTQQQVKGPDGKPLNSNVQKPSDEIKIIPTGSFDDDDE